MTLALLMFIYGMYRYWLRIYTRFALSSDRMITGTYLLTYLLTFQHPSFHHPSYRCAGNFEFASCPNQTAQVAQQQQQPFHPMPTDADSKKVRAQTIILYPIVKEFYTQMRLNNSLIIG